MKSQETIDGIKHYLTSIKEMNETAYNDKIKLKEIMFLIECIEKQIEFGS